MARVGDVVITKSQYDTWLNGYAALSATGSGPVSYEPPEYASCVGAKRRRPLPAGGSPPTEGELRALCEGEHGELRTRVMRLLVEAQWVEQEAAAQGLRLSDAQARADFDRVARARSDSVQAIYERILARSGLTDEDYLLRFRADRLQERLVQKVAAAVPDVTRAEVEEHYVRNKVRFATPERRDLSVVVTRTRSAAERARAALEKGNDWRAVAREHSIDELTRRQGGRLPGLTQGQGDRALDDAAFGARVGELAGPVKAGIGWYVFEVDEVYPRQQRSLEESAETIRALLATTRQQRAAAAFRRKFRAKYRALTVCAEGFETASCRNAPDGPSDA